MILVALSIDRYIAVCKPGLFWLRQSKFAIFVIIFCCSFSLLFILPISLNSEIQGMMNGRYIVRSKCSVLMPKNYDILQIIFCYVIPLFLICSVYLAILHKLYQHTRLSSIGRRTGISLNRVIKCSVLVVAFYFIIWTPYWGFRVVYVFGKFFM